MWESVVLFEIHDHEHAHTTECIKREEQHDGAHLNLFKWVRFFEARDGVSGVKGPRGPAADSLWGFLTRGEPWHAPQGLFTTTWCASLITPFSLSPFFNCDLEANSRFLTNELTKRPFVYWIANSRMWVFWLLQKKNRSGRTWTVFAGSWRCL